ncbi:hypothetical protein VM1G_03261 [Cytospora mali]|uniref:Uncharacterized protein n=1 Tax=Cytospora mali TaxID=578113 RepID=A0A194VUU2_CYTMA|nr:hypothetical protein VM1G_03261 [Valsa mali]
MPSGGATAYALTPAASPQPRRYLEKGSSIHPALRNPALGCFSEEDSVTAFPEGPGNASTLASLVPVEGDGDLKRARSGE